MKRVNPSKIAKVQNIDPVRIEAQFVSQREKMKKAGKLKLPKSLTKSEIFNIHNIILRDIDGKPIQKTDSKHRLLWDVKTNKPIWLRTPRGKVQRGIASKCRAYELHKMAKWDVNNPPPTKEEMRTHLFPEILISTHETRRHIFNEHIRHELSVRYCGKAAKEHLQHLYIIHSFKGLNGHMSAYQVKADPYVWGYPLSGSRTKGEIIETMKLRIAKHKDPGILGFNVYNNRGNIDIAYNLAA